MPINPIYLEHLRFFFFSYSTGLVTHEHATEISALQQARKIKPSAMNPFIMMSGLDPSQVCK
jgi:hypothetical protein